MASLIKKLEKNLLNKQSFAFYVYVDAIEALKPQNVDSSLEYVFMFERGDHKGFTTPFRLTANSDRTIFNPALVLKSGGKFLRKANGQWKPKDFTLQLRETHGAQKVIWKKELDMTQYVGDESVTCTSVPCVLKGVFPQQSGGIAHITIKTARLETSDDDNEDDIGLTIIDKTEHVNERAQQAALVMERRATLMPGSVAPLQTGVPAATPAPAPAPVQPAAPVVVELPPVQQPLSPKKSESDGGVLARIVLEAQQEITVLRKKLKEAMDQNIALEKQLIEVKAAKTFVIPNLAAKAGAYDDDDLPPPPPPPLPSDEEVQLLQKEKAALMASLDLITKERDILRSSLEQQHLEAQAAEAQLRAEQKAAEERYSNEVAALKQQLLEVAQLKKQLADAQNALVTAETKALAAEEEAKAARASVAVATTPVVVANAESAPPAIPHAESKPRIPANKPPPLPTSAKPVVSPPTPVETTAAVAEQAEVAVPASTTQVEDSQPKEVFIPQPRQDAKPSVSFAEKPVEKPPVPVAEKPRPPLPSSKPPAVPAEKPVSSVASTPQTPEGSEASPVLTKQASFGKPTPPTKPAKPVRSGSDVSSAHSYSYSPVSPLGGTMPAALKRYAAKEVDQEEAVSTPTSASSTASSGTPASATIEQTGLVRPSSFKRPPPGGVSMFGGLGGPAPVKKDDSKDAAQEERKVHEKVSMAKRPPRSMHTRPKSVAVTSMLLEQLDDL